MFRIEDLDVKRGSPPLCRPQVTQTSKERLEGSARFAKQVKELEVQLEQAREVGMRGWG